MNLISENIKQLITEKAKQLGFVKVGFSKAGVLEEESAQLSEWLVKGRDADMKWIEKGFDKRKDVKLIMEGAKSVISLAYNYYTPFEHDESLPKISRYAWGKDYHKVLKKKLKELSDTITTLPLTKGEWPQAEGIMTRAYVDDGPVMDKAWAVKSGIGWMGKHTNIINPEYGSWLFLSEIITNIEFESYDSPITDLCGSCTLCISACPTGAIISEYKLDSNLCISYHTIENRGEIPASINLSGWLFGCDICQDVCPYNTPKYNYDCKDENFYPKAEIYKTSPNPLLGKEGTNIDLPLTKGEYPKGEGVWKSKSELEQITEEEFNTIFADSPIKRTKYKGWKRNLEKL
jgi:epoxyqueuosine reductase